MYPSQLELDRNITTLRINSPELATISNDEMVTLLNQTIEVNKLTINFLELEINEFINLPLKNKNY